MNNVFLGMPPPHIKQWIKDHHGPVVKQETHIKFVDGTEGDYFIEGAMDCPALIAAGLMPPGSGEMEPPSWIKYPAEVEIGSTVTSIGSSAFSSCSRLTSVTFSGKDKATVQGMDNYSWELDSGCVLHCTDGDITK